MSEIKVNKISPATGTETTLGDASDKFIVPSGAELEVASGATIANAGTATGFGGGKTIKRHFFTEGTRTAGNSSADTNQLTITSAFIPTDPTAGNNDLLVEWRSPCNGSARSWASMGLRFTKSGGSDYDFNTHGAPNMFDGDSSNQQSYGGQFNIAAGTIPAGTYTVYIRAYEASSQPDYWNISTSDESRVFAQQHTTLLITEYKN